MTPDPLHASGWIVQRDPRLRIVAAVLFALVTVALEQVSTIALACLLALTLATAAGMRPRDLAKRLLALEGFMLILLISLPFTVSGEPLLTLGPLAASEAGLLLATTILFKANAVVLVLLVLVGTLEPVVLGHALARLGVPEKLVHLFLMTVRQIHLLNTEFLRLRQAMRARAFVPHSDRHTWRSYGWLMGMLLVRSMARAERILDAMRCRGFKGRLYLLDATDWRAADTFTSSVFLVLLSGLAVLDRVV